MRRAAFFVSLIILINLSWLPAQAVDMPEAPTEAKVEVFNLFVDTPTLAKGYTAEPFEANFRVGIFPEVLNEETNIVFKEFSQPDQWHPAPFAMNYATNIYEYDIKNQAAFKNNKPVIIEIKYPAETPINKQAYFWNKPTQEWVLMPTEDFLKESKVRAIIHLPYARVAIFAYPPKMEYGMASWYAYKDCDCAASPDYPKGTWVEVTNLDNYKMILVQINDYGPERKKHPERAIDLDVTAFKKIASKRAGVIRVKVVPLPTNLQINTNLTNTN